MSKTRYKELGYENRGDHWRIVDADTAAGIGPIYKTKAELLADLDRYARQYGCEGTTTTDPAVVIVVSGGVVQEVYAPPGFDVVLIDHDNMDEGDGPVIFPNAELDQMDEETREYVRLAYAEESPDHE